MSAARRGAASTAWRRLDEMLAPLAAAAAAAAAAPEDARAGLVEALLIPINQCAAAVEGVLRHSSAFVPAELSGSVLQLLYQAVSQQPLAIDS
jgi:hypothetical protein